MIRDAVFRSLGRVSYFILLLHSFYYAATAPPVVIAILATLSSIAGVHSTPTITLIVFRAACTIKDTRDVHNTSSTLLLHQKEGFSKVPKFCIHDLTQFVTMKCGPICGRSRYRTHVRSILGFLCCRSGTNDCSGQHASPNRISLVSDGARGWTNGGLTMTNLWLRLTKGKPFRCVCKRS